MNSFEAKNNAKRWRKYLRKSRKRWDSLPESGRKFSILDEFIRSICQRLDAEGKGWEGKLKRASLTRSNRKIVIACRREVGNDEETGQRVRRI